jgi:hypothetical protein
MSPLVPARHTAINVPSPRAGCAAGWNGERKLDKPPGRWLSRVGHNNRLMEMQTRKLHLENAF